jgi:hypothetical protein
MSGFTPTAPPASGQVGGAGTTGAAAGAQNLGSVNDLFDKLLEFKWNGVSVPVEDFDLEIRQDLVIHRYADRNGAYVEGTGRHPVQITARIPFLNTIYPGQQESWPPGALYPQQWRLFVQACLDPTSGTLQHPELGPLNCKIDLARTTWNGKVRSGVIVQATWVESDDTQASQLESDLLSVSPIGIMQESSSDMDANVATLQAAVTAQQNPLPPLEYSFSDLANIITGVLDYPSLVEMEFEGGLDNVIFQCNQIREAIDLDSSVIGPMAWPLINEAEQMKDSAYNLALQPSITGTRPILSTPLSKDATAAQAAYLVGANIDDFIILNAQLLSLTVIPSGTPVQYYASAA